MRRDRTISFGEATSESNPDDHEVPESQDGADGDEDVTPPSSPFGSTTWTTAVDESVQAFSPPAFTALQEPWPPSWPLSEDESEVISPIQEEQVNQVIDTIDIDRESDSSTAIASAAHSPIEPTASAVAVPGSTLTTTQSTLNETASSHPSPLHPKSPPNTAALSPSDGMGPDTAPTTPRDRLGFDGPDGPRRPGTVGMKPFLKRSLGGLLRDGGSRRTRSDASSSMGLASPALSRVNSRANSRNSSPTRTSFNVDGEADDVRQNGNDAHNHSFNLKRKGEGVTREGFDIRPGDEADEEDNAADDVPLDRSTAPGPDLGKPSATVLESDYQEVSLPPKSDVDVEIETPRTRAQRPTGVFVNPAFRRQVQGFLRSNAVAFRPVPKVDNETPAGEAVGEESGAASPEVSSSAGRAALATESSTASSPTIDTIVHHTAPSPTIEPDRGTEPQEVHILSPPKNPAAVKKLKPTAPVFVPKPTASIFVPRSVLTQPAVLPVVPQLPLPPYVAAPPVMQSSQISAVAMAAPSPIKSPAILRPSALPFVPGRMTFGAAAPAVEKPEAPYGGALGLFTFTHQLRPGASEFKPRAEIAEEISAPVSAPTAVVAPSPPAPAASAAVVTSNPPDSPLPVQLPASPKRSKMPETPFTSKPVDDEAQSNPPRAPVSAGLQRRHSLKDSSDSKLTFDPVDYERRHSFRDSTDLPPWRPHASSRSSEEALSLGSASEVRKPSHSVNSRQASASDDETRGSPRRRKHTARRASQNSYLSRSMRSRTRSITASTAKDNSPIQIHPSQPVRHDGSVGSRGWLSPQSEHQAEHPSGSLGPAPPLPMPGSADTYSPNVPIPSDIEPMEETGPNEALKAAAEQRVTDSLSFAKAAEQRLADCRASQTLTWRGSFGSSALNPAAMPFVFGANTSITPQFTGVSTPKAARLAPSPPAIESKLQLPPDAQAQRDDKFRHWSFPSSATHTSSAHSRSASGQNQAHKPGHSDMSDIYNLVDEVNAAAVEGDGVSLASDAGDRDQDADVQWPRWRRSDSVSGSDSASVDSVESVEFPMRASPTRRLTLVNGIMPPGNTPLSLTPEIRSSGSRPYNDMKILDILQRLEEQVTALREDYVSHAEEAERRADDAVIQTSVATEALDLIKGKLVMSLKLTADHVPQLNALDEIAHVLKSQANLLEEIQSKVDRPTAQPEEKDVASSATELKAVLNGQGIIMEKMAEFAEAQEAIYELRSATDSMMEAQEAVRDIKTDHARVIEQNEGLQRLLREETAHTQAEVAKTQTAEKEIAVLRAQIEEMKLREKDNEGDDKWHEAIRADVATAMAAMAKSASSEETARAELPRMRELLDKQGEQYEANLKALQAEVSYWMTS